MIEFDRAVLAERLKFLRTDILGLTVDKFCLRADINVNTYYNYINQKHRAREHLVRCIAEACGVSAEWLMGLEEAE